METPAEELDEVSTLSEQLNQSHLGNGASVQEVLSQNHFLQEVSQRILAKYNRERVRSTALEQELNSAQLELERHKVLLRQSEAKLAAFSHCLQPGNSDFQQAISSLRTALSADSRTQTDCLAKVEELGLKMKVEGEYYQTQFESMMQDALTSVRCRNCKKSFIPKTNSPTSCRYHPGKLHYYSCFGCGDDAYYTCCNRCSSCSVGCRTGSHVGQ